MLDPDKHYKFVIDKQTLKPACVLLQALYGGDREPCFVFMEWEVAPTPNFVGVTLTGREVQKLADKVNNGR